MGKKFELSQDLLDRCHERAPVYDRENRFAHEDFDELKEAGYQFQYPDPRVGWIDAVSWYRAEGWL